MLTSITSTIKSTFASVFNKSSYTIPLAALLLILSSATGAVALAHADTSTAAAPASTGEHGARGAGAHGSFTKPAAVGTVASISGSTITLTDKQNSTTYTVDASGATITKVAKPATQGAKPASSTIAVSGIAVGDMLMVQGTANGTNVTATAITDGMGFGGFGGRGGGMGKGMGMGVHGTVSAVNGSTITVTGQNGTTYTVDASGATATKLETISPSDIQVGDTVNVMGTTTGSTVTAKTIMDGMPKAPAQAAQ